MTELSHADFGAEDNEIVAKSQSLRAKALDLGAALADVPVC